MLVPEGYRLEKSLSSSVRSQVALAQCESDATYVILKTYLSKLPERNIAQLECERAMLLAAAGPGVARPIRVVRARQSTLVLELLQGVALESWLSDALPTPKQLLTLAIDLCDVLTRMHEAQVIHRNLSPHNVLIDPSRLRTSVLGFGFARPLGIPSPCRAGTKSRWDRISVHAYMAPEQTGRMNRGIDERSDLYALGATLYRAATGQPVFAARDPLAMLHAHMARIPTPACELRPDLPEALSRIIAKLLEKEPALRYQSARALIADLRECAEQLRTRGSIPPNLELGRADFPARPSFGSELYGREFELEALRASYAAAVQERARLLLVSGDPGVGKSALVRQLRSDMATSGGYFAVARFEPACARPYSGWSIVLADFIQQLLAESDADLRRWRAQLRFTLGDVGRALVDLVPDLEFILGETPPLPAVSPHASQARLCLALQRFLTACATPEHPLVLFLDDLHWADAGSLALVESVLGSVHAAGLLLVGAYREGELSSNSRVIRLRNRTDHVKLLTLGPLSRGAIQQMLAAGLGRTPAEVVDLARQTEQKTGSHPLFVLRFMDQLHTNKLLRFVPGHGWQWQSDSIASLEITEDVAALLATRVLELPARARSALASASCVASEFDADLLGQLCTLPHADLLAAQSELAASGLIMESASGFRFTHVRIRNAAQQLLPEKKRAELHYRLSRRLLDRLPPAERERRLLEIAEHQSKGIAHVRDDERVRALGLQLRATTRAMATSSTAAAEPYLQTARQLLRHEDWSSRTQTVIDVYLRSTTAALLRGDPAAAMEHIETLEAHPLSSEQRTQVQARRLQILALSRDLDESAHYALELLDGLGSRLAKWLSHRSFALELLWLRVEIFLRGPEKIFRPAREAHPKRHESAILLAQGAGILARKHPRLLPRIAIWLTRQNLRHGYVTCPSVALAGISTVFLLNWGLSDLTLRLRELTRDRRARGRSPVPWLRAEQLASSQFDPWHLPRRSALGPLEANAKALRELGDIEFSYYAEFLQLALCALAGDPVGPTHTRLRAQIECVQQAGHVYLEPSCFEQGYALLAEPDARAIPFEERIAAGEIAIARAGPRAGNLARAAWIMALAIYGRFDLVLTQSQARYPRLPRKHGMIHLADHALFRGLAAAALATDASGRLQRRYLRLLDEALRHLRYWARRRGTPDLSHPILLLDAERERLARKTDLARSLYDRALQVAEESGYPHHAALAAERHGQMLARLGLAPAAELALAEAAQRYRVWGCEAKAANLAQHERSG